MIEPRRHIKPRIMSYQRGNILLLVLACVGLVLLLGFVTYQFTLMTTVHQKGQSEADRLVATAALLLNRRDEVGRMNNMIAGSRVLVFASRQALNKTTHGYGHLLPLAQRLLNESRNGAKLLETERNLSIQYDLAKIQNFLQQCRQTRGSANTGTASGTRTLSYDVFDFDVGYIDSLSSNAQASAGLPELVSLDIGKGYINKKTMRYIGNANIQLPAPDADLPFNLAVLRAPDHRQMTPIMLESPLHFKSLAPLIKGKHDLLVALNQLPSAVSLTLVTHLNTTEQKGETDLKVTAAASANGAGIWP